MQWHVALRNRQTGTRGDRVRGLSTGYGDKSTPVAATHQSESASTVGGMNGELCTGNLGCILPSPSLGPTLGLESALPGVPLQPYRE